MSRCGRIAKVICAGKHPFPSPSLARAAMRQQFTYLDYQGKDRPPLNVYRCQTCGHFHVGSEDTDLRRAAKSPYVRRRQQFTCTQSDE